MKLSETETLSYEIFDSKDLDRLANTMAKAFTNSDPRRDRATVIYKRVCRLRQTNRRMGRKTTVNGCHER